MFVSRDLQVISSESQVILALPRGQAGLYGCVWLGGILSGKVVRLRTVAFFAPQV